jgi:mono/diheme cytochrome c family protein
MKKILLGALGVFAIGSATSLGLLQAGVIDVAADNPHSSVVHRLIEWAREKSIARRIVDIVPPADLSDAGRIRRGAGNYNAMCVNCHLSPGVEDSEIRKGLYPTPANLAKPAETNDARRFWIVKHGIKASGMPAWSKGGMEDESIWDLTAFLKVMPNLSPEEYRRQVEVSGGHSHGGVEEHGAEHLHDVKPHTHKHGAHPH